MNDAVIGIVLNSNNEIVVTKRRDTPIWVLPGGGIDPGETPEAAVIREIREETGLIVKVVSQCAEYLPANVFSAKTHLFVCSIIQGSLQNSPETTDICFSSVSQLPQPFFSLHQDWLKDWQTSKGELIVKTIQQITLCAILKFLCRHPIIFLKYLMSKKIKYFLKNKN
ncbi:MAG: NUDIX hydrolase [Parachlamydiaceae bacterium]